MTWLRHMSSPSWPRMLSSADDTMDIRPYWIPAWVNPRLEGIFDYISDNEMPDKAVAAESAYVGSAARMGAVSILATAQSVCPCHAAASSGTTQP